MSRAIGIDLGTTNSCVAALVDGRPVVVPNREGGRTTPSVVTFTADGQRLVGTAARRHMNDPARTITSIKRFMGRQWDEVTAEMALIPYQVERGADDGVRIALADRQYTPPEISAMILRQLKTDAEAFLGEPVRDAVITVPAYFNNAQREATQAAGRIAGLNVLRIVNEPTAASLAYGLDQAQEQTVLVFDLGGGTFDVSILDLGHGLFEVKSTNGDNHLGGDNFDQAIVNWMLAEIHRTWGLDLAADQEQVSRLRLSAEAAKVALSSKPSTQIDLPFSHEGKPCILDLSREKLNELTVDLLARVNRPIQQALADAGLAPADIGHVVLVGGMTRMPAVADHLRQLIDREPRHGVDPDEVVAIGAALQAGILTGQVKEILLLDVTPLSLGIETKGGIFTRLIARNTSIPTRKIQTFTTAEDGQSSMEFRILQGESEMAAFNKTLGSFRLDGITPARRGLMEVDVRFDIDANGILQIHAEDITTGNERQIRIEGGAVLSEAEITRMTQEAEAHASQAGRLRDLAEARNLAEVLADEIERALSVQRDRLEAPHEAALEDRLRRVRDAAQNAEAAEIRACIQDLTEAAQVLIKSARGPVRTTKK